MPNRLIILAQYDKHHGIAAHVRIHLERLRPCATKLVLVSNSPLTSDALTFANSMCDKVIVRHNTGWDFAGWRDALKQEDENFWDSIILTNSSIVGPLYPIAPIIQEMESRPVDFWGLVNSKQMGDHLQSYFLGFQSKLIRSPAWTSFWSEVQDFDDKWDVIKRYELGLTKQFKKAGFEFDAYMKNPKFPDSIQIVDVERLGSHIRLPWDINRVGRAIRDYRAMIEEGFPYLKASLLWGIDSHRLTDLDEIQLIKGTDYPWLDLPGSE